MPMLKNLFASNEEEQKKSQRGGLKRNDMVLTQETKSQICVIKTVRQHHGSLKFGIITARDSRIRWVKRDKIIKRLSAASVIEQIERLSEAFVCYVSHNRKFIDCIYTPDRNKPSTRSKCSKNSC